MPSLPRAGWLGQMRLGIDDQTRRMCVPEHCVCGIARFARSDLRTCDWA